MHLIIYPFTSILLMWCPNKEDLWEFDNSDCETMQRWCLFRFLVLILLCNPNHYILVKRTYGNIDNFDCESGQRWCFSFCSKDHCVISIVQYWNNQSTVTDLDYLCFCPGLWFNMLMSIFSIKITMVCYQSLSWSRSVSGTLKNLYFTS